MKYHPLVNYLSKNTHLDNNWSIHPYLVHIETHPPLLKDHFWMHNLEAPPGENSHSHVMYHMTFG